MPTCALGERVGIVRERTRREGVEACVVVNSEGIVLGMLRGKALAADPNALVDEAMDPGPTTFRPSVTLERMLAWMREHDIQTFGLVTTSEGRLVGAVSRADAEATVAHADEHVHGERTT